MAKKILVIVSCMLVLASVAVSAAEFMKISTTKSIESHPSFRSVENDSVEQATTINEQNDLLSQRGKNKTGFLSIPPGAFIPGYDSMDYYNTGLSVQGNGTFYAPVYLPNEATVTKLTFYWVDRSESKDASLYLWRKDIGQGFAGSMALIETYGSDGSDHNSYDDEIPSDPIDNANYSYFLELWSPDRSIACSDVLIEYTYVIGGNSVDYIQENQINEPQVPQTR